jgi:CheY-like chemotaxis protein
MQIQGGPDRQVSRARSATGGLILLVEDDFVLRSSLSELLNAEGFRVDCCADGREAYRRLHMQPRPDLILLDIMLPYLDGFELRALQKKTPPIANIPVVVISAYDLDPQSVDELGLLPPFRKPLEIDKLLAHMHERIATTRGSA